MKHYAVQLALYLDILENLGLAAGRRAFVWDVHGKEVTYVFNEPIGPRTPGTLWDFYQSRLAEARAILARTTTTRGALSSKCKLCQWYTVCNQELVAADDPTIIPFLGRANRENLASIFNTVSALAAINLEDYIHANGKTDFPGVGEKTLRQYHARAALLKSVDPKPYLKDKVNLPDAEMELFFDIEADPLRDIVYLHGFVERVRGDCDGERFYGFYADFPTLEGEKEAFTRAMEFFRARPEAVIYYYSPYEKVAYRKLQKRFPDVCGEDEIEALFEKRAIDLYTGVVRSKTEWPTRDFSIKTLAKYLGFKWRDISPSGAASIEWYDQWIKTSDPEVRSRILTYNEDDCRATRVLLDGIRDMVNSS